MSERIVIFVILLLVVLVIITLFIGCFRGLSTLNDPPDITYVQKRFDLNYNAIKIITDFLKKQDYKNIYILESNGIMQADFAEISIESEEVVDAIKQIIGTGDYKSISKRNNTIVILQWKGLDIGCGIAYTVNGTDLPDVAYMTQCQSLTKDNWYYYVSDYNSWRTGKRP